MVLNRRNMCGKNHNRKAFTLIELIVTVSIVAIMAAVTAGMVIYVMQLFVYLPREMKARTIANEIIETVTEGESQKSGLRYAVGIQNASSNQVDYTFGYPGSSARRLMRFRWNSGTNKIYRSYTAFGGSIYGAEELVPYYATGEISIRGRSQASTTIFSYFKADGSTWVQGLDPLNTIKRVEVNVAVSTGTGLFSNWESSFEATSGAEVRQYL